MRKERGSRNKMNKGAKGGLFLFEDAENTCRLAVKGKDGEDSERQALSVSY